MMESLHDLKYQNSRNNGSMVSVHDGSFRLQTSAVALNADFPPPLSTCSTNCNAGNRFMDVGSKAIELRNQRLLQVQKQVRTH